MPDEIKPKYKIVVFRVDANPNYEAEMAKFKEDELRGRGGYRSNDMLEIPQREMSTRSLEVVLSEDEYLAVKESVIATFK